MDSLLAGEEGNGRVLLYWCFVSRWVGEGWVCEGGNGWCVAASVAQQGVVGGGACAERITGVCPGAGGCILLMRQT